MAPSAQHGIDRPPEMLPPFPLRVVWPAEVTWRNISMVGRFLTGRKLTFTHEILHNFERTSLFISSNLDFQIWVPVSFQSITPTKLQIDLHI
jgi:hypothetical protein